MARRARVWPVLAAVGLALLATLPRTALAGPYSVDQCRAPSGTATNPDASFANGGGFGATNTCAASQWLQVTKRGTAATGAAGAWHFDAPAGTRLTYVALKARPDGTTLAVSPHFSATEPAFRASYRDQLMSTGSERAYTYTGDFARFSVYLYCGQGGGCPGGAGEKLAAHSFHYTLDDRTDPSQPVPGGELVTGGDWKRGTRTLTWSGGDVGGGVRSAAVSVSGSTPLQQSDTKSCAIANGEWSAAVPCPTSTGGSFAIDTTRLSDGEHQVSLTTTDIGGRTSTAATRTVRVDNTAPAAPQQLSVGGAGGNDSGWRTGNGFDIAWQQPDQGTGSPVAGYRWKLDSPPGSDTDGYQAGSGTPALDGVQVPPGTHTVYVWLEDKAGNVDKDNASTATLRFVDAPPVATAEPATGAGRPRVGGILAGTPGSYSGHGTIAMAYQWLRCAGAEAGECSAIAGATAASYKPVCDDQGRRLRLRVRAANEAGAVEQLSPAAEAVPESPICPSATRQSVPNGSPPSRSAVLTARFARSGGDRTSIGDSVATLDFGERIAASGRLATTDGRPIVGAKLLLSTRTKGSRHFETGPGAFATTDRAGNWAGNLPSGPSRIWRFGYRAYTGEPAVAWAGLETRVRPRIALRASARSVALLRRLTLRGRVLSGPVAKDMRVTLQGSLRGSRRWTTFVSVPPGPDGSFRAFWRFRVTGAAGRSFRIRAAVSDSGYPYEPGTSRPVTVTVKRLRR